MGQDLRHPNTLFDNAQTTLMPDLAAGHRAEETLWDSRQNLEKTVDFVRASGHLIQSVSGCFQPCQPQRITSGLEDGMTKEI